jgi:valyl-tRNA synthetase
VPFKDVYITPLVRDELGKKMTKSKGNVVDPLDLMNQYGADAVRFTLAQLAAQGRDVILSHDRFAASRAFANKIWNAARFVMMNLEGASQPLPKVEIVKLGLAERWILSRLDTTIREVSGSIDVFEFNVAAMKLYDFIWHEFCDWYIELSKEPLKAGGERQAGARWVLINVFDKMLRLLHPFMPFVSEEIWQVIRPYLDEKNLAPHLPIAKYPEPSASNPLSAAEELAMNHCIEGTEAINSLRSLLGWHPGQRVKAFIKRASVTSFDQFKPWIPYVITLAKLEDVEYTENQDPNVVFTQVSFGDVGVAAPEGYDFEVARQKLRKQLAEVDKHFSQHEARLNDQRFLEKADPETRTEVEQRREALRGQQYLLKEQLQQLGEPA